MAVHEGGILFRYHFISILPDYVRNTLALSTTTDLQQLALEADRIFLSGQSENSAVMSTTMDSDIEVSRVQRKNNKRHTSRTLCFYHEKFRNKAKKCVQPCGWSLNRACLEQHTDRGWRPISFFSKKLKKSKQKYSTFDWELLALYEAVQHFRYFLERRNFIMFTDHQPLVNSTSRHKQSDPLSTRQQPHLSYISEHSIDIRHIAGKHNIIADYVSRSSTSDTCNQVVIGLDLQTLAAAQATCEDTPDSRVIALLSQAFVADIPVHDGGPALLCDTYPHQSPDPLCHLGTVVTCFTCFTDWHIPALAPVRTLYAAVTGGMG